LPKIRRNIQENQWPKSIDPMPRRARRPGWRRTEVNVGENEIARPEEASNSSRRYEVQFQKDAQRHSDTNDLEQARLYARALSQIGISQPKFTIGHAEYCLQSPSLSRADFFKKSARIFKRVTGLMNDSQYEAGQTAREPSSQLAL